MKPKIKLSGADIKKFFAQNGEKLVLGLTVILLILFVMGVFNSQPISGDKPTQISQQASAKTSEITSETNLPPDNDVAPPDFAAMSKKGAAEVSLASIKWSKTPDPPLFPELMKRSDPEILPPVDLLAVANVALVPYRAVDPTAPGGAPAVGSAPAARAFPGTRRSRFEDEDDSDFPVRRPPSRQPFGAFGAGSGLGTPGTMEKKMGSRVRDADPQPKFIVTITGIVDVDKQIEEYQRRFEYAEKPTGQQISDVPRYFFAMVQRAEVPSPDTPVDNLKWENLDVRAALIDSANWATTVEEVANPAFVFGKELIEQLNQSISVTWDLPPMYLKAWGPEATHPKLPTVVPADVPADVGPDPMAPDPFNPDNQVAPGAVAPGAGRPGFRPGFPAQRGSAFNDEGDFRGGRFGAGTPTGLPLPKGLFRYVDLTAQPGKTYRYRAQIFMHNPNRGIHPQYLEKQESSAKLTLISAWSEPSAPVTVPEKYQILVESINVPRTATNEPTAKLNVLSFWKDPGVAPTPAVGLPGTGGAQPGAGGLGGPANPLGAGALGADPLAAVAPPRPVWLHLMKETPQVLMGEVVSHKNVSMDNAVDMTVEAARKVEKVVLDTNDSMLLDLRNDTPLAGPRSAGAAELLMIDASGRLYCVDSTADQVVINDYKAQTAEFQPLPEEAAPARRDIEDDDPLGGRKNSPKGGGRRSRFDN